MAETNPRFLRTLTQLELFVSSTETVANALKEGTQQRPTTEDEAPP